jgi:hypothetical protein
LNRPFREFRLEKLGAKLPPLGPRMVYADRTEHLDLFVRPFPDLKKRERTAPPMDSLPSAPFLWVAIRHLRMNFTSRPHRSKGEYFVELCIQNL